MSSLISLDYYDKSNGSGVLLDFDWPGAARTSGTALVRSSVLAEVYSALGFLSEIGYHITLPSPSSKTSAAHNSQEETHRNLTLPTLIKFTSRGKVHQSCKSYFLP